MAEMTLRQAAAFDYNAGKPKKVLGWTVVCADRYKSGQSRAARIKAGVGKSGKKMK